MKMLRAGLEYRLLTLPVGASLPPWLGGSRSRQHLCHSPFDKGQFRPRVLPRRRSTAHYIAIAGIVIAIAGCATPAPPEPIIQPVPFAVPVPVKCTPMLDPEPDYPDTDSALAETTLFRGIAILKAGRLMRIARDAELKAALAGCAGE